MSYQQYGGIYGIGVPQEIPYNPAMMQQAQAQGMSLVPNTIDVPSLAPSTANILQSTGGVQPFSGQIAQAPGRFDGIKNWFGDANNLNAAFQGISALTSAYLGFQQLSHARDSLRFQKEAFNTNMNNSIQSYNTSLEDRIRGRTSDYAGKEADVQNYLDKNRLSRSR